MFSLGKRARWDSKGEGALNGGISTACLLMGLLSFLAFKDSFFIGFWLGLAFAPISTFANKSIWGIINYTILCWIVMYFLFGTVFEIQIHDWSVDALGFNVSFYDIRLGIALAFAVGFIYILVNNELFSKLFQKQEVMRSAEKRALRINPQRKEGKEKDLIMDYDYDYLIFQWFLTILSVLSLYFKDKEDFDRLKNYISKIQSLIRPEYSGKINEFLSKKDFKDDDDKRKFLGKLFEKLGSLTKNIVTVTENEKKRIDSKSERIKNLVKNEGIIPYEKVLSKLSNLENLEKSLMDIIDQRIAFAEEIDKEVGELHEEIRTDPKPDEVNSILSIIYNVKAYVILIKISIDVSLKIQSHEIELLDFIKRKLSIDTGKIDIDEVKKLIPYLEDKRNKLEGNYDYLSSYARELQTMLGKIDLVKGDVIKNLNKQLESLSGVKFSDVAGKSKELREKIQETTKKAEKESKEESEDLKEKIEEGLPEIVAIEDGLIENEIGS